MGNSVSDQGKYYDALRQFNPEEKANLTKLYESLASEAKTNIHPEKFKHLVEEYLPTKLADRLYSVSFNFQIIKGKYLSEESFVIMLSHILKGDIFQKSQAIFHLATDNKEVNATEMVTLIQAFLSAYLSIISKTPNISSWKLSDNMGAEQRLALYLLTDLFGPNHSNKNVRISVF